MRNAITMLGAVLGIFAGGWLAVEFFHQSGDVGLGAKIMLGAIPGTFVGGWIASKLSGLRA